MITAFWVAQKRAELLRNPCILGGPQHQAQVDNEKWLPHPCPLGGPEDGGFPTYSLQSLGSTTPSAGRQSEVATSPLPSRGPRTWRNSCFTLAFSGVPNGKHQEIIRSGYLTPAFSRARKMAALLRNPCILGAPKRQARVDNEKWLPEPCFLEGPTTWRKGYVTTAFSGDPNAKRRETIRSGYLTPAFSGTQKRAELLCDPCILRGPQHQARVDNEKWPAQPCLLGNLDHGRSAM